MNGVLNIGHDVCVLSSMNREGRKGVTPFAVACYAWQCMRRLGMRPNAVMSAIREGWDKPVWMGSGINLSMFNALFNGIALSAWEWKLLMFPLSAIRTLQAPLTSKLKKPCHLLRAGGVLFACSEEAWNKTAENKISTHLSAHYYGLENSVPVLERLRRDVTLITLPCLTR